MANVPNSNRIIELWTIGTQMTKDILNNLEALEKSSDVLKTLDEMINEKFGEDYKNLTSEERLCIVEGIKYGVAYLS